MLQPKTTKEDTTKNTSKLPQKIPITYLWFGKTIPEDYLISLSEVQYPFIFIRDAELDRKFSREIMDIEKSDYYRLQYLYQHGGIFSDLDNIIDYPCLMKLLQPYRNQDKLVFMTDGIHTRSKIKQMTNNLIFAPYPRMPILRKMLDQVNEKKGKIWGFAGMRHVAKYSQPLEVNMDKCVRHIGDWSWFAASNEVLGRHKGPNSRFRSRLTKKKDIIRQNSNLQNQVFYQKQTNRKLLIQFNKLTFEYKKVLQQINNMKMTQAKKNQERKNVAKKNEVKKNAQNQKVIKPQTKKRAEKQIQTSILNDQEWTKQKLIMQNQIQQLSQKNQDLQFEKNVSLFAVGGSIIVLLILLLIGIKVIRKKRRDFDHVEVSQRKIIQESKLDSS